ncbi:hypothetical protein [Winogradskyella forsetii]|uniref:hypothetical protein n=1 Tax=Winogradskyella forsetii TaxID=2686077 RepID=UPI0015C00922|nr:hypothetical protein [Winogradskyella forsetii]
MKKIILLISILTTFLSYSQKLKEIDTLNYQDMISKKNKKKFRNGMDIHLYKAKDKNSYKVGDTLSMGIPSGINEVDQFKNRDTRFEYIFYGKPSGVLFKGMRYVEGRYRDYKVVIHKIQFNKGSMGLENYVFFYVKPIEDTDFTIIDEYITITMVDKAIERQEIFPIRMDRPMSREEAIDLLKKYKEELELEILTQSEYDKFKKELMIIIKS